MASVLIKGLTKLQANFIAMQFEDGKLSEHLNDELIEGVEVFDEAPRIEYGDNTDWTQNVIQF